MRAAYLAPLVAALFLTVIFPTAAAEAPDTDIVETRPICIPMPYPSPDFCPVSAVVSIVWREIDDAQDEVRKAHRQAQCAIDTVQNQPCR